MKEYTYINHEKVYFDINDLADVNRVRKLEGKPPIASLHGYCMSPGCSCRHPDGHKGVPHCGLFKCYDEDKIKKDFFWQILGI